MKKVTFGFVNCNRLFYLKSCVESLLHSTEDYDNKEIIVVDNASIESGTDEYLEDLRNRGYHVHKTKERDPSNEYARALNYIAENATGDYVFPIAADLQFIVKGEWLKEYVDIYESLGSGFVGCIAFDAQRSIRNKESKFGNQLGTGKIKFSFDYGRPPIFGAANCMISKDNLLRIYPWDCDNISHEGGGDSESKMLVKIRSMKSNFMHGWNSLIPTIPASAVIYTDKRGTNARVRHNKRFGDYWPPKEDEFRYYEMMSVDQALKLRSDENYPLSIEEMVKGVGFEVPKDSQGNWLKNPIRPEDADEKDFEVIE